MSTSIQKIPGLISGLLPKLYDSQYLNGYLGHLQDSGGIFCTFKPNRSVSELTKFAMSEHPYKL